MVDAKQLQATLSRIDGRGYKNYKDIQGSYRFDGFELHIDHVQGDPFATPSKIRVRVPQATARFPAELFNNKVRRVGFQDFLTRRAADAIRECVKGRRGTGKSGMVAIDVGGQEILERTAVLVADDWTEARLCVGLPAAGRRVLASQAETILCHELPKLVERSLHWNAIPRQEARRFVDCIENHDHLGCHLSNAGLVAFVADGAVLPRESGVSDRPMHPKQAVPFKAPESLSVTFDLANPIEGAAGPLHTISGMGIPHGVTLIVGGGYHGKSTLLRALERGVYPHVPGDGREFVVTCPDAVKIRAEDGRRVERVDISPFISDLPFGRSTAEFSTDEASGSTSQAANIVEALELGATLLLLDEDTSATNFMVRDGRMQALVHKEHEPITPFVDRVRELYEKVGISTILVMGGCGDYFDTADTVIMMRDYQPHDVTRRASEIAQQQPTQRHVETVRPMGALARRIPLAESFDASRGRRDVKIDVKGKALIAFGRETIELRHVEQLVDASQTRAIGNAIHLAVERFMNGKATLREIVDELERFFDRDGLDALDPFRRGERHPGDFARPRKHEIGAAINRLRTAQMRQRRK